VLAVFVAVCVDSGHVRGHVSTSGASLEVITLSYSAVVGTGHYRSWFSERLLRASVCAALLLLVLLSTSTAAAAAGACESSWHFCWIEQ
jgi:hypothetical protein